jgi:Endonuclease/Exonuclease/phosphatase family
MSAWAEDGAEDRAEDSASVLADGTAAGETDGHRPPAALSMRVLTMNTHKGFALFNRRFVLEDLRDAIRSVDADLVFLQEVQGIHVGHSMRLAGWPETTHYEYLADRIWPQFAYGRNAVYPAGHHGNAMLSKYPIVSFENHDASFGGRERHRCAKCSRSRTAAPNRPSRPCFRSCGWTASTCATRVRKSRSHCHAIPGPACRTTPRWPRRSACEGLTLEGR